MNINLRIKDFGFLKSFQNVYISHIYIYIYINVDKNDRNILDTLLNLNILKLNK